MSPRIINRCQSSASCWLDAALCRARLGQADLNPSQSTAMGNLASIVSLNSIAALQAHGAALQAHGIASLAQV